MTSQDYETLAPPDRFKCPNCGYPGHVDELHCIEDLAMRLEPGDTMWRGDCPDCGAACHDDASMQRWEQQNHQLTTWPTMLAALRALKDWHDTMGGWEGRAWSQAIEAIALASNVATAADDNPMRDADERRAFADQMGEEAEAAARQS